MIEEDPPKINRWPPYKHSHSNIHRLHHKQKKTQTLNNFMVIQLVINGMVQTQGCLASKSAYALEKPVCKRD